MTAQYLIRFLTICQKFFKRFAVENWQWLWRNRFPNHVSHVIWISVSWLIQLLSASFHRELFYRFIQFIMLMTLAMSYGSLAEPSPKFDDTPGEPEPVSKFWNWENCLHEYVVLSCLKQDIVHKFLHGVFKLKYEKKPKIHAITYMGGKPYVQTSIQFLHDTLYVNFRETRI